MPHITDTIVRTDEPSGNRLTDMFRQIFGEARPSPSYRPADAERAPALSAAELEEYVSVQAERTAIQEAQPAPASSSELPEALERPTLGRSASSATLHLQSKTPAELEKLILDDVRRLPGCPPQGLTVTIYGFNPWNAMLTIGAHAGPVKNAGVWKKRVRDIAMTLRETVDLVDDGIS